MTSRAKVGDVLFSYYNRRNLFSAKRVKPSNRSRVLSVLLQEAMARSRWAINSGLEAACLPTSLECRLVCSRFSPLHRTFNMNLLKKVAISLLCLFMVRCGASEGGPGAMVGLTYFDGTNAFSIQHMGGDTVWVKNYYSDEKVGKASLGEYYFILTEQQTSYLDSILTTVNPGIMDSSWAESSVVDGSHYILAIKPTGTSPTYLHNSVNSESADPITEWLINVSQKSKWVPSFHGHVFTSEMYLVRHKPGDMIKEHMEKYLSHRSFVDPLPDSP